MKEEAARSARPSVPGRPRGRGRRAGAHSREAILAAAERLLRSKRLDELTVAEIVHDAGVSRASFYIHFDSKYALVAALVEKVIDGIYDVWEPWLEGDAPTAREVFAGRMTATVREWADHAAILSAAVESWHTDPEIYDLWGGMLRRFTTAVTERIERDRAAGRIPSDELDSHALAAALVWLNERCFYVAASGSEEAFADAERTLVPVLAAMWARALRIDS
jgi:TetR/AcrR family transcriptional regulator, ethionamide resistance regulator